jgi:hypothetical protein
MAAPEIIKTMMVRAIIVADHRPDVEWIGYLILPPGFKVRCLPSRRSVDYVCELAGLLPD